MRRSRNTAAEHPRRHVALTVLTTLAMVTAVGACDGANVFTGESTDGPPRVVDIVMPQSVMAGETVLIRVDAFAPRSVDQIRLTLRGAVNRDTVATIRSARQQASIVFAIPIPAAIQDSVLRVQAQVADATGKFSPFAEIVALAFGPPSVTSVSGPSGVRPGETINIHVTAFGPRRVSSIDLSARGAMSVDTTIDLFAGVVHVDEIISLRVPDFVNDTLITLSAIARDQFGLSSEPRSGLVTMAIDPPNVELVVPPTVEAGQVLNMVVLATSLRHVKQIRLSYSRGFYFDTIIDINPTMAQVVRSVSKNLPHNLIVPEVAVQAFVYDRADEVGQSFLFSVPTPTGGPVIAFVELPYLVLGGSNVDLRVQAIGQRPVKRIRFRWRGFTANALNEGELNFVPAVASTSVLEDIVLPSPCVTEDAVLMILITAYDVDDQLSPVRTEFVTVAGNPACPGGTS